MRSRRPTQENTADEGNAHGGGAPFLREVLRRGGGTGTGFPFSVPVLKTLDHLRFDSARGFFLRAEDFFGFAKRLSAMRGEFLQRLADLEVEYADRSG